ncbi:MAG: amino acid adenylation domain-containing protein, partial [Chloroflexi bacterium]|nr:amino acid adenylation domain-containing protein [Chloroflexota bacterium]
PPVESHRGTTLPVELDRALMEQLASLSRQQGITLFMTLLAGWYVLLARYSGQDDIAVGTPIAGRTQPETEPLIGFFINTLVLRTSLDGSPTFRDLLDRVRATTLDAYAHQDAPFEAVVERLQPDRDRSRQPLFQVLFALMNAPLPEIRLPEIQLTPLDIDHSTSVFDLSLLLFDTASGVTGHVEYATDLFDEATITRMIQQYQLVLSAMVASPDLPIARVALIGEAEQRQLAAWNASAKSYPREAAVHQLIEAQAERTPNRTAIVFEGASLTYAELNARANQLAHYLRDQGVGPDVLVALMVERSLEMIVGMLAILKAGGAYVPLDPAYPADRLQYMLSHSQAPVILTQAALVDHLPEHAAQIFRLDADWATLAAQPTSNPPRVVLPDHLAYVIFTSGSTGRPKGVMVKQQGLINLVHGLQAYFDDPAVQITGLITSISFDISVNQIFPTLIFGRTLHIIADPVKFNSRALLRYLHEHQIHLLDAVPSYLQTVLNEVAPEQPANALRYLLIGGEKLEQRLLQSVFGQLGPSVEIVNIYGLTEISDINILGSIRAADLGTPITVGRPLQNNRIYILDAFDQPQPVGIAGEVCVSGESVSRGYLFRPELTAERFVVCPFEDGQVMVRTGDLGRWRPDGTVEILGRIDHQVKIRGFRIELGEIEAILAKHPAVREAVAIVREDHPGDQRLVAYVTENLDWRTQNLGEEQTNKGTKEQRSTISPPSPVATDAEAGGGSGKGLGVRASREELRAFLGQHLPAYMLPSAFVVLDQLPRTPNGKLNRQALPAPDREQAESSRTYVGPRNALEQQLVQIWEELLPTRPIGVIDNFFELGGHSLIAIRLVAQIQKQLGQKLPLSALFEGATIEQFAELIRRQAEPSLSPLVG